MASFTTTLSSPSTNIHHDYSSSDQTTNILMPLLHLPSRRNLNLQSLRTFTYAFTLTLFYTTAPYLYITRSHISLYSIKGPSMSPTLSPTYHETGSRDQVIFWKNIRAPESHIPLHSAAGDIYRRQQKRGGGEAAAKDERTLRRGQIIAFYTPHQPEKIAVKRIVALAGDVVRPLRRNGSPYYRGDCGVPGETRRYEPDQVTVAIPFNHAWVEGDNQDQSSDSNDYGPISLSLVDGVAGAVVWPRERAGVRDWESDGWEGRCKGRIEWRGRGKEGDVPEEWYMS